VLRLRFDFVATIFSGTLSHSRFTVPSAHLLGVGRLGENARPSYRGGVVRLADRDIRSALELVWDAAEYTGVDPFPREFLKRLASLIPADALVGYH